MFRSVNPWRLLRTNRNLTRPVAVDPARQISARVFPPVRDNRLDGAQTAGGRLAKLSKGSPIRGLQRRLEVGGQETRLRQINSKSISVAFEQSQ